MKRGRRFAVKALPDGRVWWCTWKLFARAEGVASSEEHAIEAIRHFQESDFTYSQAAAS